MAYFLFIIVVVSVSGIYNIRGVLSPQVLKFLFYLACAASLSYAYVKGRKLDAFDYPRKSYLLLLLSIVLSAFSASLFHEQSIKSSLIVILPQLMSYMMFWTWMKFGLTEKQIMKFLIVLCLVNVPVYFVNAMTFPNFLFGSVDAFGEYGEDTSRGILRLPVYYIEVYVLLLFYGINKILVKPSLKWYVLIGVFALMIVLSVMRKMMFLSAVLGLVMFLRNSSWLKRILISCAVGSVYFFVLPQIPMYQEMVALSENQILQNSKEDDIRITAFKAYVDDYQTNGITRIIGNGNPSIGNSAWGDQFESLIDSSKCFYVDVGWAGFYWLFGFVATVCLLTIFAQAIMRRKSLERQYLTYWIIFAICASVVAGLIVYDYQIITITIVLYLIFGVDESLAVDNSAADEDRADVKPGGLLALRKRMSHENKNRGQRLKA